MLCFQYLPCCCDQLFDKSNLRKEGFILADGLRIQSGIAGKEWLQECEATGYIVSIARRDDKLPLSSLLQFIHGPSPWKVVSLIHDAPSSLKPSEKCFHRERSTVCFLGDAKSREDGDKINDHRMYLSVLYNYPLSPNHYHCLGSDLVFFCDNQ